MFENQAHYALRFRLLSSLIMEGNLSDALTDTRIADSAVADSYVTVA